MLSHLTEQFSAVVFRDLAHAPASRPTNSSAAWIRARKSSWSISAASSKLPEGRIPGVLTPVGDNLEILVPAITYNEVVLYWSCPNDISSARAKLRLKRHGVKRVRPLDGGFSVWDGTGFSHRESGHRTVR